MHYDNKKIAQIAKIAFLYYKKNKNQEEISKLMSIARPTISKLISEAKDLSGRNCRSINSSCKC